MTKCTEEMYEAYKQAVFNPDLQNKAMKEVLMGGIDAAIRVYESVAAMGVNEHMSVTDVEPADGHHYWWLPQCDVEHYANPNRWALMRFSKATNINRVGLFMGPVTMPKDFTVPVGQLLEFKA